MPIELNGQNDIVRRNGTLPDELVASKAGPSLTAEEITFLEGLPPQSLLKQAYVASTAKTMLAKHQVEHVRALLSGTQLVGVTYDGNGRVATASKSGRSYTYAYGSGTLTITASDGSTAVVSLDGSNRVTGVVGNF